MTTSPPAVALLGTGALGSALGRALLTARIPVTAWNRTHARTRPLADLGARVVDEPESAVRDADVVVVVVADHDQATEVLRDVGDLAGRTVITLTSGTPEEALELDAGLRARGALPVHGAAMSGTRLVGDSSATFLYSGDADGYAAIAPVTAAWGGATYVGTDSGLASLYDTALLGLNLGLLGGAYQAMALLGTAGVDPVQVAEVASDYLPFAVSLLNDHARQVATGSVTDDDGSLEIYAGAIDHLAATSRARGLDTSIPHGLADLVQVALERGLRDAGLPTLVSVIAGGGPVADSGAEIGVGVRG